MPDLPLVPTIVLAVNSPLYAPVLIAKAANFNTTCGNMNLELAEFPHLNRPSTSIDDVDPFVKRLFLRRNMRHELLIGVGDPMRMTAVPEHGYANPTTVGGLIQSMCYWLVNHKPKKRNIRWWEEFKQVLVHPKRMTGYTVACFDYHIHTNEHPSKIQNVLREINPNNDREIYDHIQKGLVERGGLQRDLFAFITTNPLHASEVYSDLNEYEMIRDFAADPNYYDVVMTGILTSQEICANPNGREIHVINEFLQGLRESIERILDDPWMTAYYLYRGYYDEKKIIIKNRFGGVEPAFFEKWNWSCAEMAECLDELRKIKAYNPTLKISEAQWEKTKSMRKCVKDLLPPVEHERSVDALTREFCHYD